MKGIILAGGSGTRLHPITRAVSKQLLPVYDKPMIYYPLSVLMLAGIREILIITTPHDQEQFVRLLGDGSRLRLSPELRGAAGAERPGPGLPHRRATTSATTSSALVLGDNIFYGHAARPDAADAAAADRRLPAVRLPGPRPASATAWPRPTTDGRLISIEEKPASPKSEPGRHRAVLLRQRRGRRSPPRCSPSARGELEITDLNNRYVAARHGRADRPRPRHRLAGHRHPRLAAGGRPVRPGARAPAGRADRLPGGDRAGQGFIDRRAGAAPRRGPAKSATAQYVMEVARAAGALARRLSAIACAGQRRPVAGPTARHRRRAGRSARPRRGRSQPTAAVRLPARPATPRSGRWPDTERDQRGGRQRGGVALRAHHDPPLARTAAQRQPRRRRRVQPPFEVVALDDHRARRSRPRAARCHAGRMSTSRAPVGDGRAAWAGVRVESANRRQDQQVLARGEAGCRSRAAVGSRSCRRPPLQPSPPLARAATVAATADGRLRVVGGQCGQPDELPARWSTS